MDQRKRELYKDQKGNITFVPSYGELIRQWVVHYAFVMHYIIKVLTRKFHFTDFKN